MTTTNNDGLPTVNLSGIEIFAEGNWNGDKYNSNDLDQMVNAFNQVGFEPTVKAGHADGQDDEKQARRVFGAPSLGYVSKLYRRGAKLFADLTKVPRRFADLIRAGSYKRVSSEIYWNYRDDAKDKTFPRVLKSVAFLGADIPALTNLNAIEALFHKKGERIFAYQRGHEYRLYNWNEHEHEENQHEDEQHDESINQNREETYYMNQPKQILGGLTATSKAFAEVAMEYARQNDLDFPTAVRQLMKAGQAKHYEAPTTPSNELASVADAVSAQTKVPFGDALRAAASQHPDSVRRCADQWLVDQGKLAARGKPGLTSENESAAIMQVIRDHPDVAQARQTGMLSDSAARKLFPQYSK